MFLVFYAATNGLGGSPKLSLRGKPQARETQGTALLGVSFVFLRSAFMSVAAT